MYRNYQHSAILDCNSNVSLKAIELKSYKYLIDFIDKYFLLQFFGIHASCPVVLDYFDHGQN